MTDEEELRKKLLIIDKIKTETRFYHNLWESLTYAELLSLRKSNRFSRNLARQFKFYMPTRVIKDMIPVIALVSLAAYVMNYKCILGKPKANQQEAKKQNNQGREHDGQGRIC